MKAIVLRAYVLVLLCAASLRGAAQQGDIAIALGTISAPSSTASTPSQFTQGLGGGTYFGFNGDVLIKHNLGFAADINWRTSKSLYAGQFPFRPLFFSFNAIYARRFTKSIGAEALAGIGALSSRFYNTPFISCDVYGNCSNDQSFRHFLADFGGGIRLYAYHNFFVRPEVRLYLIHNNVEYSSGHAVRYGASIGYTFGSQSGGY